MVLLCCMHYASGQSFAAKKSIANKELMAQIKAYQAYVNQLAARYHIKYYMFKVDYKNDKHNDSYTLSTIFYAFEVERFNPSWFMIIDEKPVLFNSAKDNLAKNTGLTSYIKKTYFSYEDSAIVEIKKPTDSSKIVNYPRDTNKVYYIDSGKIQDVPIVPKAWFLTFRKGKLISKTESKYEMMTQ